MILSNYIGSLLQIAQAPPTKMMIQFNNQAILENVNLSEAPPLHNTINKLNLTHTHLNRPLYIQRNINLLLNIFSSIMLQILKISTLVYSILGRGNATTKLLQPPTNTSAKLVTEKRTIVYPAGCDFTKLHQWNRADVKNYHDWINGSQFINSLMIWSKWSDGHIMPSMKGLAYLSSSIKKKNKFANDALMVCETLQSFRTELERIQIDNTNTPIKRAFVIPTHSTDWGHKEKGGMAGRFEHHTQHIVTVVVEKIDGKLHIALMDPMNRAGNEILNPDHIGLGENKKDVRFTEKEIVLSYITASKLNPATTKLYHSSVLRETGNGCWAFALKDAIGFLNDRDFFNNIKLADEREPVRLVSETNKDQFFELQKIEALPLNFMKTATLRPQEFKEHFDANRKYFKKYPDHEITDFSKNKLLKHCVENQNMRIGHLTAKWMKQLLEAAPVIAQSTSVPSMQTELAVAMSLV
ncbi:MAG: hypothetical protein H0W88_05560 [Parachlamydiaceae bacterium]|nr:hypothetical protein [Parachlamydiaceae bacterium]